jgi:hypothetical protein
MQEPISHAHAPEYIPNFQMSSFRLSPWLYRGKKTGQHLVIKYQYESQCARALHLPSSRPKTKAKHTDSIIKSILLRAKHRS